MKYLHEVYTLQNYKKHYILLKTTSEIPLFVIKEDREQTAAFDYYKYEATCEKYFLLHFKSSFRFPYLDIQIS